MLELRSQKELALCLKILQDERIRIFYKHTSVRGLLCHHSLIVHELYEGHTVFAADAIVVLAERGRRVDDSRAVRHRDIAVADYEMSLFILPCHGLCRIVEKRLVFPVLESLPFESLDYLVRHALILASKLAERLVEQRLCHIVGIAVRGFYLAIFIVWIDAESEVRRKRPGRRRPSEKIGIFTLCLESHDGGTLF